MEETLIRIWENLGGRIGGPMKFRLLLQPLMVSVFAIRAGIQDARAGRPPFLWTVLSDPQSRSGLLRNGWKDIAKVFALAIGIDVVYQLIVERWVYPLESVIVAIALAVIPYALLRGPVTRIVRALNPAPLDVSPVTTVEPPVPGVVSRGPSVSPMEGDPRR